MTTLKKIGQQISRNNVTPSVVLLFLLFCAQASIRSHNININLNVENDFFILLHFSTSVGKAKMCFHGLFKPTDY